MIIRIETINKIFAKNNGANQCSYHGLCQNCGCDLEIKITKTSGGYGLKGGALYEPDPKSLLAVCDKCHVNAGSNENYKIRSIMDLA